MKTHHIYISNLFRFRFWMFVIGTSVLVAIPLTFIPILGTFLWFGAVAALVYYFLGVQMACNSCGRLLATQRVAGLPEVCSHCGHTTDKGMTGL